MLVLFCHSKIFCLFFIISICLHCEESLSNSSSQSNFNNVTYVKLTTNLRESNLSALSYFMPISSSILLNGEYTKIIRSSRIIGTNTDEYIIGTKTHLVSICR
jgi:hypothetical protein